MVSSRIPIHSTIGKPLQASKWQTCALLVEVDEMQELLASLGEFWIVQVSGLIPFGEEIISQPEFLNAYDQYIAALKRGECLMNARLRSYFSSVFTKDLQALYAVQIKKEQILIKAQSPVVQLQAHHFDYSTIDGKFRSMSLGHGSIYWGLQFAYPSLYQDQNLKVFRVREHPQLLNTLLFKNLQQWVRSHTIATPFEVEGRQVNVPIRLGKKCLKWINSHPHLQAKDLRVKLS